MLRDLAAEIGRSSPAILALAKDNLGGLTSLEVPSAPFGGYDDEDDSLTGEHEPTFGNDPEAPAEPVDVGVPEVDQSADDAGWAERFAVDSDSTQEYL